MVLDIIFSDITLAVFLALLSSSIFICIYNVKKSTKYVYQKNVFFDAKKRFSESTLLDADIRRHHVEFNHDINNELEKLDNNNELDESGDGYEISESQIPFNRLIPVDLDSHFESGTFAIKRLQKTMKF